MLRFHIFLTSELVSDSCQQWLPELDARRNSQPHIIHMVVRIYTRRSKRQLIRFGDPLPEKPIRAKRIIQNTIYEGLKIQAFINHGPGRITWAIARKELNISEAKLAHLLKIVNTLPPAFIESMKNCDDPRKLKIFNGRKLLNIARLKTKKERHARLRLLMRNYNLLPHVPVIPLPSTNAVCQPIATITM
jgi:hypothetical protein